MKTRTLGHSDLAITPVGIGTAPIGSGPTWRIYWGPQSRTDSIRAIDTALEMGVNWIDTAPFYGWGEAEDLVGDAIAGRRDSVLVFTKCGVTRAIGGASLFDLRPGCAASSREFCVV
jgi:aryl-alcohol dehydrogenase-like predicted oxidoreductase